jgi:molecular chaperone DnaK
VNDDSDSRDRVLGIDLGTTNSCVAVVDAGVPEVIPNRGGYKTTPSMVAVTEAGRRLVGHLAKRQSITNAEHTVQAAKRLIGRRFDSPEVEAIRARASYAIVQGPNEEARIELRGRSYSVPELSALVLQEMKIVAEDRFPGETITKAVITVPAYFDDAQRQATKDAGQIAGLEVVRIINEPTAAALAYGYGKVIDQVVAVVDLGGGTFDVSILEIGEGGVFRVVATAGDTFLGGEDFDARVIDWLLGQVQDEHGVDHRGDRMALQRLKDAAEKAKCELSTVAETEINLPFIANTSGGAPGHLLRSLSRSYFESLVGDLVEHCISICRGVLADAQLDPADITNVLLVGGMTRMPLVQAKVAELFGREPTRAVHPDEAVALGAAIQGHALATHAQDLVLLDVAPHTLGVLAHGGELEELVAQNTTLPTVANKVFTTSRDNQTTVRIRVIEREISRDRMLGELVLDKLRPAPRGTVELEVAFVLDTNGILAVTAKDLETGYEQAIEIQSSSGLTQEEIVEMARAAQEDLVERKRDEGAEAARQERESSRGRRR